MTDTQPAGTPAPCRAQYRSRGRHDRIVECHLERGHPGEHEEADTEFTWTNSTRSPEPSTPPAQPSGERRAAAGPPPGTLDGPAGGSHALPAVIGRVTLTPAVDDPIRELLLVDPEAWQRREWAIEAARQCRAAIGDDDWADYAPVVRALAAAVDALDRPTTGSPDPVRARIGDRAVDGDVTGTVVRCRECGGLGTLHQPDELPPAPAPAPEPAEPAPQPSGDLDKLADMIASSPETWKHITDRYPGLAHLIERVIDPDLRAAAAPEPAGDGPGWCRDGIQIAAHLLPPKLRAEVDALLADREQLASINETALRWMRDAQRAGLKAIAERDAAIEMRESALRILNQRRDELDAARAELPEVTADRDRLATELGIRGGQLYEAERDRDRLAKQLAEWTSGERRWVRGVIHWEDGAYALRDDRDQVRRDAAADALLFGAALAVRWGQDDLAGDMRRIAAEIRAGTRPVPGSPQPAPDGEPERNAKPCTKHAGSTCHVTTQYHYDGPCPAPVEHTTLGELAAKEKHWLCGCGFCSASAPDGGEGADHG